MRTSWLTMIILSVLAFGCSKHIDDSQTVSQGVMDSSGPYPVIKMPTGLQYHTGLVHRLGDVQESERNYQAVSDCGELPAEFDLRTLGVVPPVKDQGQCGSCWTFSETGSLESAMLGAGKTFNLAEQELVSCDSANYGCQGGNISNYQISHGEGLETDFPYTGTDSRCKSVPAAAKGLSWVYVGAQGRAATTKEIQCALYTSKTIPWITVSASNAWGNPPASEMTPYTRCGSGQTNHAVGVVGWHTISGKVYLIMKNSWGTSWGSGGYMSLAAASTVGGTGCDSFGDEVAYLTVDKPTPPPTPTPIPPTPIPPCGAVNVKQQVETQVLAGSPAMLGVEPQAGVTYIWFVDGVAIPGATSSMLSVVPPKDAVYKLVGKNACSQAESSVRVRIVMSKQ